MSAKWTTGNTITLLENGEAFFPAVFEAIGQARQSVVLETFIIFDDKVGQALQREVIAAARRGVRVDIVVDGYGTADLPAAFIEAMTSEGVGFHIFDPRPRRLGMRTNLFRRLHRKIVIVDNTLAFVGGINFSADHLADFGPTAKQDYAVSIRGPLVDEIVRFMAQVLAPVNPPRLRWGRLRRRERNRAAPGGTAAALVVRDNDRHKDDIEVHYRLGMRAAKSRITIANAYFFPGYRLLRELRGAARRGVHVRLILQGEPDMPAARFVATMLYDYLLSAGVEIYEYCERPLHGKVAVVDGAWSTVGSSNLDPLSLALNLEANVMIQDTAFSQVLEERLDWLIANHCQRMRRDTQPRRKIQRVMLGVFVFHFLRRFPAWAGWLPARKPQLQSMAPLSELPHADPVGEDGTERMSHASIRGLEPARQVGAASDEGGRDGVQDAGSGACGAADEGDGRHVGESRGY
ncbi:cardiolipin synthase ClsB [Allopusillimonas soli]|uniref:Cardiolipin synthase B n=1 Tax=Allopusillimonas soli TaxID=659016 RepID=A0A853F7T1_9BURK|nr:cardiolipin synthase ClsB [Allopusillimonas soli]NYT36654.1 cardiolipin synthase ClsB [Allopusillimonas soli]TEA75137.1 cardiolipin synthase ClsB [Allopusillimonas soli]